MKNPLKNSCVFAIVSSLWGMSMRSDIVNNGSALSYHFVINLIIAIVIGWWSASFEYED